LEWSEVAACRGSEAALFYPTDSSERKEDRAEREQMAKRICSGCEVRDECLHAAIARHETYGIWGGLNEFERRSLLRS
jgi:WhiB family redox-sensing transcriptional regulator